MNGWIVHPFTKVMTLPHHFKMKFVYESPDKGKTVYRREHGSDPSSNEEISLDEAFDLAIEEKAAELEITVDYYMAEFM